MNVCSLAIPYRFNPFLRSEHYILKAELTVKLQYNTFQDTYYKNESINPRILRSYLEGN